MCIIKLPMCIMRILWYFQKNGWKYSGTFKTTHVYQEDDMSDYLNKKYALSTELHKYHRNRPGLLPAQLSTSTMALLVESLLVDQIPSKCWSFSSAMGAGGERPLPSRRINIWMVFDLLVGFLLVMVYLLAEASPPRRYTWSRLTTTYSSWSLFRIYAIDYTVALRQVR